jgi:hypothetical protein
MNLTKQVIIEVPLDAEIPNLDSFPPEEREEMLKIGYEYVLRVRNYAVGEKKIRELRDEVRGEYEETIHKMEKELDEMRVIEKYLMRTGEEKAQLAETRYQSENEKLKKEMDAMTQKLREMEVYYEKKMEKELAKEIQREKEVAKIVNDEREKRVELYKEMDEKLKVVYEYINMYKSTSELGSTGEKMLQEICRMAFRDIEEFEIKDVHTKATKGDYHLEFKDMTILIDSKLYTSAISSTERDKIKRDLMKQENIHFAWLVSMDTPVMKFDKGVFAFEWIAKDKCVCYINSLRKSNPVEVVRALYYVCKMLNEYVVLSNQKECGGEEKEKLGVLEKYKETIVSNLEKYQKFSRERDKALRDLKEIFNNQDELIRSSLDTHTNEFINSHYNTILTWWNDNVEEKEGGKLSSVLVWNKFRKDNAEYASSIDIGMFKDILMTFVKECSKPKGKDGKMEIMNVGFKISSNCELPPETTEIKMEIQEIKEPTLPSKVKLKNTSWTEDEKQELVQLYSSGKKVLEISELMKRKVGGILNQLKVGGVITKYTNANGYSEYKASSQYSKFYDDTN